MYQITIKDMQLVILAGRFSQKNGWDHTGMKRTFNILVHIEEGRCVFHVEGVEYALFKDDIILIPQSTFYRPYTDTFCQYSYYHFLGDVTPIAQTNIPPISASELQHIYLPAVSKVDAKTHTYLGNVLSEMSNYNAGSTFRMNLSFLNALNRLVSCDSMEKADSLAEEIEQYICNHLRQHLTLSDVSEHFHYTKQYIIQLFKDRYGITPTKYINHKRLDLSLAYLTETNLKINEIAEKCGFIDANYFSRIFRARFDTSPLEYRAHFNTN